MYGKEFCKVYNEFGWNYYPEAFGEQLIEWLKLGSMKPLKMLDIGCGTGILCEIMSNQGIECTGIDLSDEMIKIAKQGNNITTAPINYQTANMITYIPKEKMDLVTCTGDALNHLTDIKDIKTVFEHVYDYLNPDGAFIFDILNGQEGHKDEPFILDYSDSVKAEFRITKDNDGSITLRTAVYENDVFKFEEKIYEIYYDPNELIELLTNIGFRNITCSDQLLPGEAGHGTTWFITARK